MKDSQKRRSQFQAGSGCYTCGCCGKRTRSTGDEGNVRLCATCYDLGGWENSHSDFDHATTPDPDCPICQEKHLFAPKLEETRTAVQNHSEASCKLGSRWVGRAFMDDSHGFVFEPVVEVVTWSTSHTSMRTVSAFSADAAEALAVQLLERAAEARKIGLATPQRRCINARCQQPFQHTATILCSACGTEWRADA